MIMILLYVINIMIFMVCSFFIVLNVRVGGISKSEDSCFESLFQVIGVWLGSLLPFINLVILFSLVYLYNTITDNEAKNTEFCNSIKRLTNNASSFLSNVNNFTTHVFEIMCGYKGR